MNSFLVKMQAWILLTHWLGFANPYPVKAPDPQMFCKSNSVLIVSHQHFSFPYDLSFALSIFEKMSYPYNLSIFSLSKIHKTNQAFRSETSRIWKDYRKVWARYPSQIWQKSKPDVLRGGFRVLEYLRWGSLQLLTTSQRASS